MTIFLQDVSESCCAEYELVLPCYIRLLVILSSLKLPVIYAAVHVVVCSTTGMSNVIWLRMLIGPVCFILQYCMYIVVLFDDDICTCTRTDALGSVPAQQQ